jgi:hypothetical protein
LLSPYLYYTYAYVTLELLFFIGAFFYSFRIIRLTGIFRAWILLVASLGLIAIGVVAAYLRMVLFESVQTLEAALQNSNPTSVLSSSAYGLAVSALLFFAMFELYGTFRGMYKPPPGKVLSS